VCCVWRRRRLSNRSAFGPCGGTRDRYVGHFDQDHRQEITTSMNSRPRFRFAAHCAGVDHRDQNVSQALGMKENRVQNLCLILEKMFSKTDKARASTAPEGAPHRPRIVHQHDLARGCPLHTLDPAAGPFAASNTARPALHCQNTKAQRVGWCSGRYKFIPLLVRFTAAASPEGRRKTRIEYKTPAA